MAESKAPLAELEGFKDIGGIYDFIKLTYPRRIDNILNQGHYINFYIYMHSSSRYYNSETNRSVYSQPTSNKNVNNSISFEKTSTPGYDMPNMEWNEVLFHSNYRKIKSAISLYTPDDSMAFTSHFDWSQDSLTRRLGSAGAIESIGDTIATMYKDGSENLLQNLSLLVPSATGFISDWMGSSNNRDARLSSENFTKNLKTHLDNQSRKLAENISDENFVAGIGGLAINPRFLMMYRTTGLRKFAFRFVFSPNNAEEAADVRNIIKMFRFHASPETYSSLGRFHLAPSIFEIEFKYKNNQNTNIPKIGTCALASISVDYAPRGWSTHTDGMPIHTILELHFIETEIITRQRVDAGY